MKPNIMKTNVEDVLKWKVPSYTPEWKLENDEAGYALLKIFTYFSEISIKRLNEAPQRHFLSFLETLNTSLLPAQPAGVPLTFVLSEGTIENVPIPALSQVSASGANGESVLFETEKDFMCTPSKLVSVFSVVKETDKIFEHKLSENGSCLTTLFNPTEKSKQDHILYIGDKDVFNVKNAKISIKGIGLKKFAISANVSWKYAKEVTEKKNGKEVQKIDWSNSLSAEWDNNTGSCVLTKNDDHPIDEIEINGLKSRWVRCRVSDSQIADVEDIQISELKVSTSLNDTPQGIPPDSAFFNDIPIDLNDNLKLYPFGKKPQIYSTFYLACEDAFSKKNYPISITFNLTPGKPSDTDNLPQLSWEYWDGKGWRRLTFADETDENVKNLVEYTDCDDTTVDTKNVKISLNVPSEIKQTKVNGQENYWIRVRLVGGDYGKEFKIISNKVTEGNYCPPAIKNLKIIYPDPPDPEVPFEGEQPEYIMAKNNLVVKKSGMGSVKIEEDETANLSDYFIPFESLPDEKPAVYFGFDKPLKGGNISLLISRDEGHDYPEDFHPRITWQFKTKDNTWTKIADILDGTDGFTESGLVQFVMTEEMRQDEMFGIKDLYWIRAVFTTQFFNVGYVLTDQSAGSSLENHPPQIFGFYLNSTMAVQSRTIANEIIGSSNGEQDQKINLMNTPVMKETIWVNEFNTLSEGDRTALKDTLNVEEKFDEKMNVIEFWVKWHKVSDLLDSRADDRHYMLDETSGEICFGDEKHGKIPAIGQNNIKTSYSTGGGKSGNIPVMEISNLESSIPFVDKVYNPILSDGGCDTETIDALIVRAPALLKHRNRAVTLEDFQQLAKDASRKVARVKVLPNIDSEMKYRTGRITAIIVPESLEIKPMPSQELRQRVWMYLNERCHNVIILAVRPPSYVRANLTAELKTNVIDAIPVIEQKAKKRISEFFHPLTGGMDGNGWKFGSTPCISDLYSLLSGIENVNHVEKVTIELREDKESNIIEISETSKERDLPQYAILYSGDHKITTQLL